MSQKYKFRSLEFFNDDKNSQNENNSDEARITCFTLGESKTIDFHCLDGTRQNFSYSQYLTSWFGIEDNERVIKIFFATHLVTIRGLCLDGIYEELIKFNLKSVRAEDERYVSMVESDRVFVSEIEIAWKKVDREI